MVSVLYLDDEVLNLTVFKINFKSKFNVFTANDPVEALDLIDNEQGISIIISDMKMPVMSGIEFIDKAYQKYPEKKYIILTGYELTDEIQSAIDSGMVYKYFSKPYNQKAILAAVEEINGI